MTFNMHMENKTYKEPKISKLTPIKDLEGRDEQAVTDHVICVVAIHVVWYIQYVTYCMLHSMSSNRECIP